MEFGAAIALLPFLIPLGVVLAFVVLQVALLLFTGFSFDMDHDADVDLDVDVNADVDVDLDLDADVGVDAHIGDLDFDVDHDVDHDAQGGGGKAGFVLRLLTPLGLGQVPLSIIWQSFGLFWGLSGLMWSYALRAALTSFHGAYAWAAAVEPLTQMHWAYSALTLPLSFMTAWALTRRWVRLVAPLFKVSGKAESERDLIGKHGRVVSLLVTPKYGEVCIEVNNAPNYMIVRSGSGIIERGTEVVVVEFDVDAQRPVVAPLSAKVSTSEGVAS